MCVYVRVSDFTARYQLDLPDYASPEVLGSKLIMAIQNAHSFELH